VTCRGNNQAGFTLVEVLISLFIFSLITAGTMTALTQSLRGKDRLAASMEELNQLNSARAIMRADMSTLTLRPSRDELGGINPYVLTTDGEALLSFTRRGRENLTTLLIMAVMAAVSVAIMEDIRFAVKRTVNVGDYAQVDWYVKGANDFAESYIAEQLGSMDAAL